MAIFIDKNKKDSGYFLLKDNEENNELFKIYLTEDEMIQLKNEIQLIESPNER